MERPSRSGFSVLIAIVFLSCVAAGAGILLGSAQAGRTITVGPSGCDFATIQAAIDAAPNGSTIQVQAGTYRENLTIRNRDGLTLQGAGADKVALDGGGPQQKDATPGILILSSRNITVTGFRITNSRRGLEADDSTLLFIENNILEQNLRQGIYLLRSEAHVIDNSVRDTQRDVDGALGDGVLVSAFSRVSLLDNEVTGNADCGLRAEIDPAQAAPEVTGSGNNITGNRGGDLSGDLATSLLAQLPSEGTQARVNVPGDVPTIQMAVDRVQPGGTIVVAAGTYQESVQSGPIQIFKSLRIVGAGSDKTVLQAPGSEWVAVSIATNDLEVTLEGLRVTGGRRGVQVNTGPACSITLRNVSLEGNGGGKATDFGLRIHGGVTMALLQTTIARNLGIGLSASSGQPKVRIEGSTIADNSSYGLVLQGAASATIEGTTISRNGSSGVGLWENSSADLSNCTTSDNVIAGIQVTDFGQVTVTDTRVAGTKTDSTGKYGNGISASRQSKTTIRNCTISGNALWGVRFYESATGTAEKSVVSDSGGAGIVARGSANVSVDGCTIARNAEEGVFAGDSARVEITNSQVTDSKATAASSGGYGLNVIQDAQATIKGNTISRNANAGILLQDNAEAAIQKNTISDNTSWGIYVVSSAHASIEDNTITGTRPVQGKVTARGVQLSGDGRTTILRNQITQNREYGIAVGFAVQVTIQDNTITGNSGSGLKVGFSDVPTETVQAEISGNTIQKNGSCGVTVAEDEPAVRISGQGNTISGNAKGQLCGAMSKFPKGFGGGK